MENYISVLSSKKDKTDSSNVTVEPIIVLTISVKCKDILVNGPKEHIFFDEVIGKEFVNHIKEAICKAL